MAGEADDAAARDVMSVGDHCAFAECAQLDFLPFRCSGCAETFCLAHRGCAEHRCPHAGAADVSVLICPLCAASVRLPPGGDANAAWAAHAHSAACDPAAYASRVSKPRCPVAGCREKLVFSNRVACKACGATTCLRHRYAADHGCAARAGAAAAAAAARRAGSGGGAPQQRGAAAAAHNKPAAARAAAGGTSLAALRAAAASQYASADNSLRGTAARRAAAANPHAAAAAALPEACSVCGARFADVAALIAHAEAAHSVGARAASSGSAPSSGRLREVCPACGARFADAVALVEHHDAAHGSDARGGADSGWAAQTCAVC